MSKALVAYFSASGTTKCLAERLAGSIGADLHEIAPKVPYTHSDLNWQDRHSRSSVEMNDRSARPEIASRVQNMAQYYRLLSGDLYGFSFFSFLKSDGTDNSADNLITSGVVA